MALSAKQHKKTFLLIFNAFGHNVHALPQEAPIHFRGYFAYAKGMAVVAQLVEPSVVVRVVAGSSPVDRPILLLCHFKAGMILSRTPHPKSCHFA